MSKHPRHGHGSSSHRTRQSRAVSETLGFVFVFALIISMVGLVYTSGITSLQHARDAERVVNAERAFDVLAHNLEDVTLRGAPSRATEIKLADAQLTLNEGVTINTSGELVSDPTQNFSSTTRPQPIRYDTGSDSAVIYENGAVIRQDGSASVMKRAPPVRLTSSESILPLVATRSQDSQSIGGSTTILVRADHSATEIIFANATGTWDVWVNVTSPRAEAWQQILEEEQDVDCTISGDEVNCNLKTERIYIVLHRINIEFEA